MPVLAACSIERSTISASVSRAQSITKRRFLFTALSISFEEGSVSMSQFKFASRAFSRLPTTLRLVVGVTFGLTFALPGRAQSAPSAAPAPDVIMFTNGDQLTGKLLREVAGSVTFHSDIAGDVTVTWDKVKSIHTSQQFAVIQQGQHVNRKTPDTAIAHGP